MVAETVQLFRRELEQYLRRKAWMGASDSVVALTQFANAQGKLIYSHEKHT